ncbi:MAG: hypothetical protein QOJ94_1563 [Sphingomonadales bacterium]|nr:hypothetical protein [Sphingomonadales bacterium]
MFRRMMAVLLLAAPSAAAFGQNDENMGGWALATMPNGCMVQATSPQGTMLTIWGFAGADKLAFLLQNREWSSLQDGRSYALSLSFEDARAYPVDATARAHIDSDGPGLFFTVAPGGRTSGTFLTAFTSARGMRISQNGHNFDTLPLAGSKAAVGALAKCLAERWSAGAPAAGDDDSKAQAQDETTTI